MNDDVREVRNYTFVREISEFGKSRILIVCPYCNTEVWAYKWSLAGCGKKCPGCGAIHTSMAGSIRRVK